jgi:dTDP-glucose pyrophosphorylase
MKNWKQHIITEKHTIRQALHVLNEIGVRSGVLFITDDSGKLLGSLTDGDIRRGFLKDAVVDDLSLTVMNPHCRWVRQDNLNNIFVKECREQGIMYIPVVNDQHLLTSIINLSEYRDLIPVEAVVMAGGKGERLLPLTKHTPKPLLKIGDKPILEHNIDRLIKYGIKNIHISVNYLGHQIEEYLGNGKEKNVYIHYIWEKQALGTIGAVSLVEHFEEDVILIMNSDLLTNIDFADFYNDFTKSNADMAVATVPHHVEMPYAIVELNENRVMSFKEKPRYTYFANAGIYMVKKKLLSYIPKGSFFNATDLMEKVIKDGKHLINYPILEYWLDIGRASDYQKAQEDIRHLVL